MDELYTMHIKLIEYLYKCYTGLLTKPGKPPFMSLQEFRNFIMEYGLDKYLPLADIPLCFNLSMMSQLDEVDSERCAEMSFVEFLESIAHIAEYANLPHISKEHPEDLTEEERTAQPLWVKTEALLHQISNNSNVSTKLLQTFALPKSSLFNSKGELIED